MPRQLIPSGGGNDRMLALNMYADLIGKLPATTGNIWFVDSGAAAGGNGVSPEGAKLTLDAGNNLSNNNANNGDIVCVLEGHAENITGAAGLAADVNGVSFIGLGHGRSRPVITWTTAIGAQITVAGNNVLFKNLVFNLAGFDAVTAGFSITGTDVAFEDCEFVTNTGTAGCVLGILTGATATRFRLTRCRFLGPATNTGTTTTAQVKHEVGIDYVIEDSYFIGKVTNNILNATAVLGGIIKNSYFHTYTGTESISLHASSTPFISDNRMVVPSGTAPIIGAAASYSGNRYTTEGNGPTAGTADAF